MEHRTPSIGHRTKAHPLGLPGLEGRAKEAVEEANQILNRVWALCGVAAQNKVMVSIENPASSTLWHTPQFWQWAAESKASCVTVHYCRYGCNYVEPTRFVITTSKFNMSGSVVGGICGGLRSIAHPQLQALHTLCNSVTSGQGESSMFWRAMRLTQTRRQPCKGMMVVWASTKHVVENAHGAATQGTKRITLSTMYSQHCVLHPDQFLHV